ncbi:TRAFs-binding domain-containing protein [Halomonas sp. E14]|uniref:TRAFs-binding domain-containing protein n=1 Tax=Halomonas sp. E14 TaxID=3397245 RepID=UPI00403EB342
MKPYCFVLMPFGRKSDESGRFVEFDAVYDKIIAPAIEDASLEPIRADEEIIGGIIHKPMFERLMMCEYAVADLTTANANVFYELGIRHGVRPYSTVPIAASGMRLPFDVAPLRAIFYELDDYGFPVKPESARKLLRERLEACRDPSDDSPLYQLLMDFPRPDLQRLKTDSFRDLVEYSKSIKERLRHAREEGRGAVNVIEKEIEVVDADPAIVIDIFLSYRAVKDWQGMIDLVNKMAPPLKQTILVQEQLGFALNRLQHRKESERILIEIIDSYGPSSETNGILGRVYKDQWAIAKENGSPTASAYLKKAIDAYLQGFEADWRDAYPGINAVTLMECSDPPDPRRTELIPVVAYSVKRRLASKNPDYWDHATELEVHVLSQEAEKAHAALGMVLASIRETWEPETTANNIRMIRKARESRGADCDWIKDIESALEQAQK